jgi:hypothetical protein
MGRPSFCFKKRPEAGVIMGRPKIAVDARGLM